MALGRHLFYWPKFKGCSSGAAHPPRCYQYTCTCLSNDGFPVLGRPTDRYTGKQKSVYKVFATHNMRRRFYGEWTWTYWILWYWTANDKSISIDYQVNIYCNIPCVCVCARVCVSALAFVYARLLLAKPYVHELKVSIYWHRKTDYIKFILFLRKTKTWYSELIQSCIVIV